MVVAQAFGILVELLPPADEDRFDGRITIQHGLARGQQTYPGRGHGLNLLRLTFEQGGTVSDVRQGIFGAALKVSEGFEVAPQTGHGPTEL